MKLKYYLRGLGIGIVVTAILTGVISNAGKPLSDAQIKERAAQLGMVESSSMKLSDLQTGEPENQAAEPTAEPQTTEPAREPSEPAREPAEPQAALPAEEPSETMAVTQEAGAPVTVTVNRGDSSVSVSRALAEAGLVEDAGKYDRYLCDNGYSKSISIGIYRIAPGTSEEEIAKIITGKQ